MARSFETLSHLSQQECLLFSSSENFGPSLGTWCFWNSTLRPLLGTTSSVEDPALFDVYWCLQGLSSMRWNLSAKQAEVGLKCKTGKLHWASPKYKDKWVGWVQNYFLFSVDYFKRLQTYFSQFPDMCISLKLLTEYSFPFRKKYFPPPLILSVLPLASLTMVETSAQVKKR